MKQTIKLVLVTLTLCTAGFSQSGTKLSVGDVSSHTFQSSSTHHYEVNLKKGEFVHLNVHQKELDVKIITYAPDKNKIEEFDSRNGGNGDELVLIDANEDGNYTIEVVALNENKKNSKGNYTIEFLTKTTDINIHLDGVLTKLYNRGFLPGFAISAVNRDSVVYQNALGYASIKDKIPYTENTVQNIASISKTCISLSLMMLVEEGKISLDTQINEVLPFKITNPYFPNIPITVRHLATHTSSINDSPIYYKKAIVIEDKDILEKNIYPKEMRKEFKKLIQNKDMEMQVFIEKMLTKEGNWYKKKNFFKSKPGTEYLYSNVGAAVAAYIVELVSKTPYDEFVRTKILEPYNLTSAVWGNRNVDDSLLAKNYAAENVTLPKYKLITYPDGQIYINNKDLSTYLMNLMNGYFGNDNILSAASFNEMMKVQYKVASGDYKGRKKGLFWEHHTSGSMGHNGGDYGVIAMMAFHPETKMGYTFMCNMDPTEDDRSLIAFEKIIIYTVRRYFVDVKKEF